MNELTHRIPHAIKAYQEGDLGKLDLKEVGGYLHEKTSIPFSLEGMLYDHLPADRIETLARELAQIKVRDPGKRFDVQAPLQAECDYEERRIRDPGWKVFGILYEGVLYQKVLRDWIWRNSMDTGECTLLLTNQLFGTWDRGDLRYHARTSLYGFPHLISVAGIVEAPAKPKEFYFKKQMGRPVELLKEEYRGRFLDHHDDRLTEALKGYAMQAFFFQVTGDAFCEDKDCRLFNSHWQEELLHSQINGQYEFCPRHETVLREIRERVFQ